MSVHGEKLYHSKTYGNFNSIGFPLDILVGMSLVWNERLQPIIALCGHLVGCFFFVLF